VDPFVWLGRSSEDALERGQSRRRTNPMRTLLKVTVPVHGGNKALKDGTLGKIIGDTMDRIKPEASFFGVENGNRVAFMFFDLKEAAQIPGILEPLFHGLEAQIDVIPVMNGQELKAGLDAWQKQG
jgi:hypothetical protein